MGKSRPFAHCFKLRWFQHDKASTCVEHLAHSLFRALPHSVAVCSRRDPSYRWPLQTGPSHPPQTSCRSPPHPAFPERLRCCANPEVSCLPPPHRSTRKLRTPSGGAGTAPCCSKCSKFVRRVPAAGPRSLFLAWRPTTSPSPPEQRRFVWFASTGGRAGRRLIEDREYIFRSVPSMARVSTRKQASALGVPLLRHGAHPANCWQTPSVTRLSASCESYGWFMSCIRSTVCAH